MKKYIYIACFIVSTTVANAQQEALFTHYMHNTLLVNPGYAGTRNALTVTALHRNQWVGFDGAPKTYTLTAHTPIIRENIGLGLSVSNDEIGPIKNMGVFGDISYQVQMTKTHKLSLGIKAGVSHLSGNFAALDLYDNRPDPAFAENINSRFLPNFGFGVYYYGSEWYAGVSSPRLLTTDFFQDMIYSTSKIISEERHYFFIVGSVFEIIDDVRFMPSSLIRVSPGAPLMMDISAVFSLDHRIELGFMHRTGDSFGALVGYYISDQFRVGYSYDWSVTNPTFRYNGGSHEVILRYDFIFKERQRRIVSPRYF